jgi:hypothetical protein
VTGAYKQETRNGLVLRLVRRLNEVPAEAGLVRKRQRLSRPGVPRSKERIIESMTGSAPKQGFFESDEKYRSRIAHDANERLVEKATGEAPRQGPFRWRETGVCPSGGSRSPAAWFAREIELQALASLAALAQISTVCRSFPKISISS